MNNDDIGKHYRVIAEGATLRELQPQPGGGFRAVLHPLAPGDVIEYTGKSTFGSDSVPEDYFRTVPGCPFCPLAEGAFSPAFWGNARTDNILEEVTDG